jgi:AraC family transcriptional regulator, exoenzyme S synthesis regulatory protein ExsA
MNIHNLPDDLFSGSEKPGEEIIIHHYSAMAGSFKGRSILHRNAVSLVIQGAKTMHFAEKKVFINSNEFHFLSAGNCLASMDVPKEKTISSILMFFSNKVLSDFYVKHDSLIRKLKEKYKLGSEPYISIAKDAFTHNYISSLSLLGADISTEMKLLKFEELMLHLLHTHPQEILSFQMKKSSDLEDLQIRKAVETNISNNITVEELAFLCNMSLSTFKRKFQKLYATSPNKWILQRRMEMAKDLLSRYNEKPSEVYHKVGYENHSSFSESFKNTFGLTPTDFQQRQMNVKL